MAEASLRPSPQALTCSNYVLRRCSLRQAMTVSEDEDDYDCRTKERKRFFEVQGRENLILVGAFLVARNLSSIVIVLELVLVLDFCHCRPSERASPRM
jgi:hypothetical protein